MAQNVCECAQSSVVHAHSPNLWYGMYVIDIVHTHRLGQQGFKDFQDALAVTLCVCFCMCDGNVHQLLTCALLQRTGSSSPSQISKLSLHSHTMHNMCLTIDPHYSQAEEEPTSFHCIHVHAHAR